MSKCIQNLTQREANHIWQVGHRKGVFQEETPPPLPRLLEQLESQDQTELVLMLASDPTHTAYTTMEKLIAKPIYMCARGETGLELFDANNRPIITPRGQYREIPYTTPLKFAREFDRKLRANKAQVDNRIVTTVKPNPKKPGTNAHSHYNQYVPGKSVSWHIINTEITRADIRYDIKRGFVKVLSPAEYAQLEVA